MQSKNLVLARELSAHFCGVRVDIESPGVVFVWPKKMWQSPNLLRPWNLVLEIRIREADINALFAFVIAENGFILGAGNIAVSKDVNNKVLWYCYGQPLCLFYRKKRGWFCSRAENHLYIFGLLPGCNQYEIYKAEVKLIGKGGKLLWQKVCEGQCFYRENWIIAAEERSYKEWPPLAELFVNPAFQDKLRPYIFRGQIPPKGSEAEEEKSEKSLSEVLL